MKILLFLTVFCACMVPRFYLLVGTGINVFNMRVSVYCCMLFLILFYSVLSNHIYRLTSTKIKDILVFFIWLLMAILQLKGSMDYQNSISEIYYIFLGFLSVFVFNAITRNRTLFKTCFAAITTASIIHISIGLYEILTKRHLFPVGVNDTITLGFPVSIFLNRNDFYTFISVTFVLVLAFINSKFSRKMAKMCSFLFTIPCVFLMIFGQSDTLILVVIFLLELYIMFKFTTKFSLPIRILIGVLGIGAVAGGVYMGINSLNDVIIQIMFHEQTRINLLKNGFEFLQDTHGLGIGYGNTQYYLQYRSIYNVFDIFYFHNWYGEILFCGGVFVFIVYMLFHIRKFSYLYKGVLNRETLNLTGKIDDIKKNDNALDVYLLVSFAIFSVVCISSSSCLYSEWIWMYLGLISAYTNCQPKCIKTNDYKKPK